MIPNVRKVMNALEEFLKDESPELKIIRKNQAGEKPNYPFGAWGVLNKKTDRFTHHQNVEISDPTKVKTLHYGAESIIISLSFYDVATNANKPIDTVFELCDKALEFLQLESEDVLSDMEVVILIDSQSVQDRTTYLDPAYEYQAGFDLIIKSIRKAEKTVDAVDIEKTFQRIQMEVA